jgi:cellulose synthase/poly-beta-1,6-N-acetylglucosamine synthase-like glycosyltransferase
MNPDPLTYIFYPILAFALFFETFLLLTFLSRPARHARTREKTAHFLPAVALIIPCYNEETTVAKTATSALTLDYPADKLRVILVNDGSKDATAAVMETFRNHPQITIINKENGGKHTALNAGIDAAEGSDIVGCVDADTYLEPDALVRTLACFEGRPNVAAAFSSIAISTPKGPLQHIQSLEYTMGSFFRHALASINAFFVTPGPFSLYRRDVIVPLGNFRFGQQTEDMEIAMRLLRAGYEIENAPGALVTTYAQDTLGKLVNQRTRWASGYFRNVLFDYRDLMTTKRLGVLGFIVIPMGLIAPLLALAVVSISLYLGIKGIADIITIHGTVPLAWSISKISFHLDWFYAPVTLLSALTVLVLLMSVTMAYLGKRISGNPVNITPGMIFYTICYGFLAPVWYLRSVVDVSTGTRRGWR